MPGRKSEYRRRKQKPEGNRNTSSAAEPAFLAKARSDGEREILSRLDPNRIPRHVAIIMDGNGRWARRRRLPRLFGHRQGMETVREILKAARDLDIEYVTLYAFSAENWHRPRKEVSGLMHLLKEYLRKEVDELDESNVKMLTIGTIDKLPAYARTELIRVRERLKKNTGQKLVLALNYGGRDEIVKMTRRIASEVARGKLKPSRITEDILPDYLDTAGIPDPDLMIRTSGEMRLSNFLLWQLAYAELIITDTLWPDYSRLEFFIAIAEYQRRERRFGGIGGDEDKERP
ncbi:MAG: isoprenyl transferase [Candidatus Hydrogenedentota bacterium]|nr:MAG: isoprenyl transferase [Candidatus Hydrogenedentota bacterium]